MNWSRLLLLPNVILLEPRRASPSTCVDEDLAFRCGPIVRAWLLVDTALRATHLERRPSPSAVDSFFPAPYYSTS